MAKNPRLIDMSGRQIGDWKVLHQAGNAPHGGALWMCRCVCGETREVLGADLRGGRSRGCGCQHRDKIGNRARTHGGTGTRLYRIWLLMRARCQRSSSPSYKEYGARGIDVCPEWGDFAVFREWALRNGYADNLSIDRIDGSKGYCPENCRWADHQTQSENREYVNRAPDGELWLHKALRAGITKDAFYARKRAGWPMEQAVSWPMGKKRRERPRNERGQYC